MLIAANSGAKIINASWHVLEDSGLLSHAISVACQHCVVVVAAGNYGSNNTEIPTLPASYGFQNMVVTMASDRHDDKCWFSNYGATVDLAAPGMRVQSTGIYYINPRYPDHSGTSPAAAHVSAAAALLLAIDNWTPNEIREHLNASADRPRSLQGICRSEGRLNLRRAVCGPFVITSPSGGPHAKGLPLNVTWTLEYTSPQVITVDISIYHPASGTLVASLGSGISAAALGHVANLPNLPRSNVVVRLKCLEKNLYTDSALFDIA